MAICFLVDVNMQEIKLKISILLISFLCFMSIVFTNIKTENSESRSLYVITIDSNIMTLLTSKVREKSFNSRGTKSGYSLFKNLTTLITEKVDALFLYINYYIYMLKTFIICTDVDITISTQS